MANEVVEKVQKDRVLNNSSDEDGNDENEHSRTAMPHDALFREPESVRGDLTDHHTQSDPYQVSTGFEPTRQRVKTVYETVFFYSIIECKNHPRKRVVLDLSVCRA